jgi:hypothetical protein
MGSRSRQAPYHLEHPAQCCGIDIGPDPHHDRAKRDLHPAHELGRNIAIPCQQHPGVNAGPPLVSAVNAPRCSCWRQVNS